MLYIAAVTMYPVNLILVVCTASYVASLTEISIDSRIGNITGLIDTVTVNGVEEQFVQFMGIPYAEAPMGDLRFQKPVAKAPFESPYNATYFREACPQEDSTGVLDLRSSEDCLFLNIFAPIGITNSSLEKYPVMVFLHGGAFIVGSSNHYIADVMSVHGDVIVVTLNYRLSILGFLSTGDRNIPGNFGLWDQHLAFKWINSNIEDFHGNPGSVTIFGESAGSSCVLLNALYPGNKNLFHRVIAESGTPIPTYSNSNFFGKPNGRLAAEVTGCPFDNLLSCLRNMSVENIYNAIKSDSFVPVFDNDFVQFMPQAVETRNNTISADVKAMFASVDLMIGANSMESAIQMIHFWADKLNLDYNTFNITKDTFIDEMIPTALKLRYEKPPEEIPRVLYDAVVFQYTDPRQPSNSTLYRDMALQLSSDLDFFIPCVKTADFHANVSGTTSDTYFYLLSARMSLHDLRGTPSWMTGADHGDAIYFIFGFSQRMMSSFVYNQSFRPTLQELTVSNSMMTMWTNFAKSGNPNRPVNLDAVPVWPPYDAEKRSYIDFSYQMSDSSSNTYFGEPYTSFWLRLMPSIISASEVTYELTTLQTTTEMTKRPFSHVFHVSSVTSDNIIIALIVACSCMFVLSVILCAYAVAVHGRTKYVIQ